MALYSGKFITVSPTFICVAAGEIIVVSTYVGVTVFPFLSTVATVITPPGAFILTPLTPFPVRLSQVKNQLEYCLEYTLIQIEKSPE